MGNKTLCFAVKLRLGVT